MNFIVVGTNHKTSPIEFRERLSLSKGSLKDAILFLKERGVLEGAVILSTCNRVEVYASVSEAKAGIEEVKDFISRYYEIDRKRFSRYLYRYEGRAALGHLFQVASGLDSLILGETQILGQVKFAASLSEKAGFIDEFLSEIFYSAVSFAKRVHRSTKISEGKVSVGSVAIDFIKEKIGSLTGKNLLIIGVGKVTELVLKYLKEEKPNVIFIANRTFDKARDLANQINAKVVRFDDIKEYLTKADVVISATRSPHFVIKKETLNETSNHKVLIIDLALPRDVEPIVGEIKNVDLFCLEDLGTVIEKNKERRNLEAVRVKKIIDREADRQWLRFIGLGQEQALLR